ncbi:MAG: TIGR04255 family protein [Bacteriovoracaceae bacterium]
MKILKKKILTQIRKLRETPLVEVIFKYQFDEIKELVAKSFEFQNKIKKDFPIPSIQRPNSIVVGFSLNKNSPEIKQENNSIDL